MKFAYILIFFYSFSSFSKEILSDKALFRVTEEIIFQSDLSAIGESIEKMRCLKTDGLALELLGLDRKSVPKLPNFKKFELEKNYDFLKKVILFKKVGHFIDTQSIILDSKLKTKIENDSCVGMSYSKWSLDLKRFFDLEVYIQKRFVAIRAAGKKENLETAINSAKVFLTSLDQKIPHYVFY
jgi:hypothetical protein